MRWRKKERGAGDDLSAQEWSYKGSELLHTDLEQAEMCYRQALAMDPTLHGAWFDLGLVHKWRREWADCLACNRKAAELAPIEPQEPAYWNAGIAATALEDWPAARWAWAGYGIHFADGEGPLEEKFGRGVVRLPVGETVWGDRIDPARMVLSSVPLPDSGFRYGDIVLHDGAPSGTRVSGGKDYPVFDTILRWRASPVPTVQVVVDAPDVAVTALVEALDRSGVHAENWTESIAPLCKACSLGRVDYDNPDHAHHGATAGDGTTSLGCSGDPAVVGEVVRTWAVAGDVTVLAVEEVA
jgi:hypothetical protein